MSVRGIWCSHPQSDTRGVCAEVTRAALDDFVYSTNCVLLSCFKFTLGMHALRL